MHERLQVPPIGQSEHVSEIHYLEGYEVDPENGRLAPRWGDRYGLWQYDNGRMAVLTPDAWNVWDTLSDLPNQNNQPIDQKTTSDTLTLLKQLGALTYNGRELESQRVEKLTIAEMWLHATSACDRTCEGCGTGIDQLVASGASFSTIDTELARSGVDAFFRSAVEKGYTELKIKHGGGEPTLGRSGGKHGEALGPWGVVMGVQDTIARLSDKYGVSVAQTILSNGAPLSDAKIADMKRFNMTYVPSVWGYGEVNDRVRPTRTTKNTFPIIEQNIIRAIEAGIDVNPLFVAGYQNVGEFAKIIRFFYDRKSYEYLFKHTGDPDAPLRLSLNYYRPPYNTLHLFDQHVPAYIQNIRGGIGEMNRLLDEGQEFSSPKKWDYWQPDHTQDHTCGATGGNYVLFSEHGFKYCHELEPLDGQNSLKRMGSENVFNIVLEDLAREPEFYDADHVVLTADQERNRRHAISGCPITRQGSDRPSPVSAIYAALTDEKVALIMRSMKRQSDAQPGRVSPNIVIEPRYGCSGCSGDVLCPLHAVIERGGGAIDTAKSFDPENIARNVGLVNGVRPLVGSERVLFVCEKSIDAKSKGGVLFQREVVKNLAGTMLV